MISIDASTNGKKISFIKMDVEGFELQALKGAKECIKRDHPRLARKKILLKSHIIYKHCQKNINSIYVYIVMHT